MSFFGGMAVLGFSPLFLVNVKFLLLFVFVFYHALKKHCTLGFRSLHVNSSYPHSPSSFLTEYGVGKMITLCLCTCRFTVSRLFYRWEG